MEGTDQATKHPRPLSSDSVSNMHQPKRHQPILFGPNVETNHFNQPLSFNLSESIHQVNQPFSFDGISNIDPTNSQLSSSDPSSYLNNSDSNQQLRSTFYGSQSSPPSDGYTVPVAGHQDSLDKR